MRKSDKWYNWTGWADWDEYCATAWIVVFLPCLLIIGILVAAAIVGSIK